MLDYEDEPSSTEEIIDHPRSFCQLIKYSMIDDSPYHYLSLLSLEAMIWNLDILVYLLHAHDLQVKKPFKLFAAFLSTKINNNQSE